MKSSAEMCSRKNPKSKRARINNIKSHNSNQTLHGAKPRQAGVEKPAA